MQHRLMGIDLEKCSSLDGAIKEFEEVTQLAPNFDMGFLNLPPGRKNGSGFKTDEGIQRVEALVQQTAAKN